jgi:hypothetical protein
MPLLKILFSMAKIKAKFPHHSDRFHKFRKSRDSSVLANTSMKGIQADHSSTYNTNCWLPSMNSWSVDTELQRWRSKFNSFTDLGNSRAFNTIMTSFGKPTMTKKDWLSPIIFIWKGWLNKPLIHLISSNTLPCQELWLPMLFQFIETADANIKPLLRELS